MLNQAHAGAPPQPPALAPVSLHDAAREGRRAATELLLCGGGAAANIDERDSHGNTPLHWATIVDCPAVARLLLNAGADPDAGDASGSAPLHVAAGLGHHMMVEALAAAGADVNRLSDDGFSPMHHAAFSSLRAVQGLASYGAVRTGCEVSFAEEEGQTETAAWLTATADHISALHHAGLVPPDRARTLLRGGADLHAAARPGAPTPLGLARELAAAGSAPAGSTARLVLAHGRLRRWRVVARFAGRLALLQRRAAERVYAPGGRGMLQCRDEFERLARGDGWAALRSSSTY